MGSLQIRSLVIIKKMKPYPTYPQMKPDWESKFMVNLWKLGTALSNETKNIRSDTHVIERYWAQWIPNPSKPDWSNFEDVIWFLFAMHTNQKFSISGD